MNVLCQSLTKPHQVAQDTLRGRFHSVSRLSSLASGDMDSGDTFEGDFASDQQRDDECTSLPLSPPPHYDEHSHHLHTSWFQSPGIATHEPSESLDTTPHDILDVRPQNSPRAEAEIVERQTSSPKPVVRPTTTEFHRLMPPLPPDWMHPSSALSEPRLTEPTTAAIESSVYREVATTKSPADRNSPRNGKGASNFDRIVMLTSRYGPRSSMTSMKDSVEPPPSYVSAIPDSLREEPSPAPHSEYLPSTSVRKQDLQKNSCARQAAESSSVQQATSVDASRTWLSQSISSLPVALAHTSSQQATPTTMEQTPTSNQSRQGFSHLSIESYSMKDSTGQNGSGSWLAPGRSASDSKCGETAAHAAIKATSNCILSATRVDSCASSKSQWEPQPTSLESVDLPPAYGISMTPSVHRLEVFDEGRARCADGRHASAPAELLLSEQFRGRNPSTPWHAPEATTPPDCASASDVSDKAGQPVLKNASAACGLRGGETSLSLSQSSQSTNHKDSNDVGASSTSALASRELGSPEPPANRGSPRTEFAPSDAITRICNSRDESLLLEQKLRELADMENSFRGEFGSLRTV